MACNKESAEKSADPEGEFFDYRRKNSLFFSATVFSINIKNLSRKAKNS
jgi:hypothetical protein